jgi:insulysin
MKDETFHVPKGHVYFQLTSPEAYESPKNCVLSKLVTEVLKESLNEISYHAEVAGLEYTLDNNTDGLLVNY